VDTQVGGLLLLLLLLVRWARTDEDDSDSDTEQTAQLNSGRQDRTAGGGGAHGHLNPFQVFAH
jgi:hypothetical protein